MYIILWEYRVKSGFETEFESVYGAAGDWAQLFRRGDGYLGTELLRDASTARRYLTIDRWTSRQAFDSLRRQWAAEYSALDLRCDALTEHEAKVADFVYVD